MDAGEPTDAGASCPSGAISTMAPSAFTLNKPYYVSRAEAFIVRDSGGLFGVSAVCTHQGCIITAETSDFYCNCHGSAFTFTGQVTQGPARSPLQHYALCLADGVVTIDRNSVVSSTQRLNA
jgi:Rieske Fe-S protein